MELQDVTISVPKRLFKEAQALAVLREKSLGQLLREVLEEKIREVTGYKKSKNRQIKILKEGFNLGTNGSIAVSRQELYER